MTPKIYGIARFTFAPADAEAVIALAKACMEASRQDLTGTQAYEWFMAPGANECTVLEIYDGMEGLSRHGRAVGKIIPEILARTSLSMDFAGDMPPEAQAKYRRLFPELHYSGRRMFGKCRGPASAVANPEAVGAHMRNANAKMTKVLELVTSKVEMFGAAPPAMIKRFRPELGVTYVAPQFQGIL